MAFSRFRVEELPKWLVICISIGCWMNGWLVGFYPFAEGQGMGGGGLKLINRENYS